MHNFGAGGAPIDYGDEIEFWSRQLSEHALFVHLGLLDQPLRVRALELHQQWEAYRKARKNLPPLDASAQALALAIDTRSFLAHVHDRLSKGQWIGWLWPLFIDHIRREGDYFIDIMQHKPMDGVTTCKTWIVFMAEHAAFAAHLLDPTEAAKIRAATAFIGEFERLHGGCSAMNEQLLTMTAKAGTDLDHYFVQLDVGGPKLKSIIHPVLAEHVVREGRRFLGVVEKLKAEIGPAGRHTLA
jgi:hypothetical protein